MPLKLKNPHSILAALETRPQDVIELRLPRKGGTDVWDAVRELAEAHHIRFKQGRPEQRKERRRRGGRETPEKTGREGAGEALVRELPGVTLGELLGQVQKFLASMMLLQQIITGVQGYSYLYQRMIT